MIRGQKVMGKGTNKVIRGNAKVKNTVNRTGGKGIPGDTRVKGGNTPKPFAQLPNGGKAKKGGSKLPLRKAGA